jgi:hypothetical protein
MSDFKAQKSWLYEKFIPNAHHNIKTGDRKYTSAMAFHVFYLVFRAK